MDKTLKVGDNILGNDDVDGDYKDYSDFARMTSPSTLDGRG